MKKVLVFIWFLLSTAFQFIVLDESLAGVPVLSRPVFNPIFLIFFAKFNDAKSPTRPAVNFSSQFLLNHLKKSLWLV